MYGGTLIMSLWIEKIRANNLYKFAKPAEISTIRDAEKELSLSFSSDYIEFLHNIGACICFEHEINGLTDTNILNVISLTKEQKALYPQTSSSWYAIEDTHMDGMIIWQDSNGCIYQAAPNDPPKKIASCLSDLLNI